MLDRTPRFKWMRFNLARFLHISVEIHFGTEWSLVDILMILYFLEIYRMFAKSVISRFHSWTFLLY